MMNKRNKSVELHTLLTLVTGGAILLSFVCYLCVSYYVDRGQLGTSWLFNVLLISIAIAYLYFLVWHNRTIQDLLISQIDLEKYKRYFDIQYKKANLVRKKPALQASYLADGQYYYFRGEFEKSMNSLYEIEIAKAGWNLRRRTVVMRDAYRLFNCINQKHFETIVEDVEAFSHLKGKEVPKLTQKLKAMYTVASGGTTDYFKMEKTKYKLFQIEATYFQGLNLLNQDKKAEAKECFASIVNENPDLFYVKEAKRYVEKLL